MLGLGKIAHHIEIFENIYIRTLSWTYLGMWLGYKKSESSAPTWDCGLHPTHAGNHWQTEWLFIRVRSRETQQVCSWLFLRLKPMNNKSNVYFVHILCVCWDVYFCQSLNPVLYGTDSDSKGWHGIITAQGEKPLMV